MKINNDSSAIKQATTVNQLTDLVSLLKRLGSLPASVISNSRGQLLLTTQFGNIQPQNQLPLQAGQQVLLRLNQNTGQPTITPLRTQSNNLQLPVASNRELATLLDNQRPALAKVVSQSPASTQIRLNGTQVAMPKLSGLSPNQLLSVKLTQSGTQIELQALDRKPLLKALLSQLVSRSQRAGKTAAPLVELFRSLGQQNPAANGRAADAQPASGQSTATQNQPLRIDSAFQQPIAKPSNPSGSKQSPGSDYAAQTQASSLLQLLPKLSSPQVHLLRQWIAPFIQQKLSPSGESNGLPAVNPLRLLQQISNGSLSPQKIQQLLHSLASDKADTPNSQSRQLPTQESRQTSDRQPPPASDASRLIEQSVRQTPGSQTSPSQNRESQLNLEMLQLQSREATRLVEQIGHQTQTQRTSVSLQHEIQQPLAFALSLPVMEDKQLRQLDIKVEQRNQAKDKNKQGWDARLSFEFGAMGMVSCHIFLLGDEVSSSFYCTLDETRQQFEASLPSFRQQLIHAGFEPREINSYLAPADSPAPTDSWQLSESILDIEV